MPTRVVPEDVKAIMQNKNVDGLDAAIAIANQLTNEITGLDDERLKEIERWLAAHFASISSPALLGKTVSESTINYTRGTLGKGFEYTPYGQQAKLLDSTGTLAKMDIEKAKAAGEVVVLC